MGLKQAFANVPLRSFFDSVPEVRALCSVGITRLQRSYGPVRLPVPAAIPSDGVGTKLHRHGVSLSNAICLPGMPCSLPRWTEPVLVSVSSRLVLPSPFPWRVGVHNFAFEACSSFTRVTACRVARPPYSGLLSRGFDPASYPTGPLVSYHVYRQLHGWVLPPLANCAGKAHMEILVRKSVGLSSPSAREP